MDDVEVLELEEELQRCAEDPDRFNSVVLARRYTDDQGVERPADYWSKQREVCRSLLTYRTTCAPSGNGVGKSFLGAGVAWWFAESNPGCRVVLAAPTLGQLQGALWSEMGRAHGSAARNGYPLGGRIKGMGVEYGEGWSLECFGSGSTESRSGRHAGKLLAIVDEASGVPRSVLEAIDSLNPSHLLYLGNPLRPEGKFYELCEQSGDNPHVHVIRIPSTLSPDIGLKRSPRGMADRTWLEASEAEYGTDSQWWLSHVLALFPGSVAEQLLPGAWLDLAAAAVHLKAGDVRMGIDIGEGVGADPSCVVLRDDNGVIDSEESNRWDLEALAERARYWLDRHGVEPGHVVFDASGPGADFDNRLRSAGIAGAKGYKGARSGGDHYLNLRSYCHWQLRRRLDPRRTVRNRARVAGSARKLWLPQQPFAIPKHLVSKHRAELAGVLVEQHPSGVIALEPKESFKKRLKHSPNFLDALAMTYAYPHAGTRHGPAADPDETPETENA